MRLFGFDINVQRREAVQGVPSSTNEQQPQANGKTSGVHGASYEANIVYARSPQVALSVSAVHRAVELRAKTLAMMLLQYQTKDKIGGNFQQDTSRYGNGMAFYAIFDDATIKAGDKDSEGNLIPVTADALKNRAQLFNVRLGCQVSSNFADITKPAVPAFNGEVKPIRTNAPAGGGNQGGNGGGGNNQGGEELG